MLIKLHFANKRKISEINQRNKAIKNAGGQTDTEKKNMKIMSEYKKVEPSANDV